MLIFNPDLINSCRVCRSPNQDGEYECLYQSSSRNGQVPVLSEAGILYENLLNISLSIQHNYPQFLCNSCDLQMKLFKKLKDKAYKTLEYLQIICEDEVNSSIDVKQQETLEFITIENYQNSAVNDNMEDESQECEGNVDKYEENEYEECTETNISEYYGDIVEFEEDDNQENKGDCQEYTEKRDNEHTEKKYEENTVDECEKGKITVFNPCWEEELEQECLNTETELSNKIECNTKYVPEINSNVAQTRLKMQPVNGKSDIITDMYELLHGGSRIKTSSESNENVEYEIYKEEKTETSSVLSDIEYVVDEDIYGVEEDESDQQFHAGNVKKIKLNDESKGKLARNKRRDYKCQLCQLEFTSWKEQKLHRIEVHNEKYPCDVCSKEFKTMTSLQLHMKIHNDEPAYQCEICQKTFNQKAHYQYHMNRHNNVRNFKCNECEKSFLSKSDLKVHMRFHTGQRPYVCNICGKDYLMMEHLKTHLITHTEQYFQCEICQNKFTTHKTLRLHVKTIHEDDPKFKCTFCGKPFRRKHHLEYHLRLHQKNVRVLDSQYQLIHDPGRGKETNCNIDFLKDDEEAVDDPEYLMLDDDVM